VFSVVLLRRGSFPFQSTVDKGNPGFRGVFVVRCAAGRKTGIDPKIESLLRAAPACATIARP
jgi:hypothetical protein